MSWFWTQSVLGLSTVIFYEDMTTVTRLQFSSSKFLYLPRYAKLDNPRCPCTPSRAGRSGLSADSRNDEHDDARKMIKSQVRGT